MALSVTSNFSISAGYASNNMKTSQTLMGKSINRISSGLKAPKPADNAVSYVSGTKLKADSEGYNVLSTGIQDTAAKLNMADSVLSDVNSALLDLKAKAIARASTSDSTAQGAIDASATNTIQILNDLISNTTYKGDTLFSSTAPTAVYTLDGSNSLSLNAVNVSLGTLSVSDLSSITTAIDNVTTARANLGGDMSALETISNYLSDLTSSADAAYTAVTEVDYAREMTQYVKNNVQSQAAQAMVAQANQGLAQVLNLLQV
ncbi:MAG: hypothetical protein IJU91_02035 [Selenomonadaceae bacterium]|nr:hypothetical protein [Selenomonadaceae bacterium]